MKTTKRILSFLFLLVLVCAFIPAPEASAAKNGYMSLEEAGAVLREYMVTRNTSEKEIKFYLDEARQLYNTEAYDLLLAEAVKHTGVSNEGDALKWSYKSVGYGVTDNFDGTTHYITLTMQGIEYNNNAAQEDILNTKIQQILQQLNLDGKSDYEKVFAVYDYVCKNVRYADEVIDNGVTVDPPAEFLKYYSAYGALVLGEATCQGFALAMYRLLLGAGIDNRLIDGDNHGWNIVRLGNLYYCLDATWDSDTYHLGDGNYKWFLKGASDFWTVGHTTNAFFGKESFRNQYPISPVDHGAEVTATGSGKCGDNANWELTADGTLTISGSGAIYDMNEAFENWNGLDEYVKKIVIQSGITAIGSNAFHNFQEVREVSIPSTVTSIGEGAFGLCTKLATVTIPDSVTGLGSGVFANCFSLKAAALPNGLKTVPYAAFMNCAQLENITVPSGVTTIEENAFYACYGLKSVVLPDTLKAIGGLAFASAFDMAADVKITIPSSVTEVGLKCFAWSNVNEVVWNANTEKLDYWAFYLCHNLEKITISDSVKEIGESAFQDCNLLKEIKLPAGLKTVGDWTFLDCASLSDIQLPDTLEALSGLMFSGCRSLKSIDLPENITVLPTHVFEGSGLTSIDLTNITEIGYGALSKTDLVEVVIPAGTKVGPSAFFDCKKLKKAVFKGDAPDADSSIFGVFGTRELVVYYPADNATWTPGVIEEMFSTCMEFVGYRMVGEHFMAEKWMSDGTSHWYGCLDCNHKENVTPHEFESNCDMDCGVCGYQRSITHIYTQKYNDGFHWMECACGDLRDEQVHVFDDSCDASCRDCPFVREPIHSYYIRMTDDDYHWYECDCGAKDQVAAHEWDSNGVCICGMSQGQQPPQTHTHSMSSDWTWDEEYHWKYCTSCDYIEDKAAHRYTNNCDDLCDDCGAGRTAPHNFQWKYNTEEHWKECACGVADGNFAPHTMENGGCSVCGMTLQHTHTMGDTWLTDGKSHWKQCTGCSFTDNLGDHDYTGNCDADCDICGYTRSVPHNFGTAWEKDTTHHWQACDCGAVGEKVTHTWNTGAVTKQPTCKDLGVKTYTCTVCSATKTESVAKLTTHTYDNACDTSCNICGENRTVPHSYQTVWSNDKTGHWHACALCGNKKDQATHTPGPAATDTMPQTCTTCGYVIQAALSHTHSFSAEYTKDASGHWFACECGEKKDVAEHSFDNGCDTLCDACGYTRDVTHSFSIQWQSDDIYHWRTCTCGEVADKAEHNYGADGFCTVCSAEDPNGIVPSDPPSTEPPTEPSTTPSAPEGGEEAPKSNSFVWVIVIAVVVVAAGAAAAVVIVMKKKK